MKNDFGLEGVQKRPCEGNREFLKNCHIYYIKLKTRAFSGLGSCEISREKHRSFYEKLLVAEQSRDSCDSLCMKLKIFSFCLENLSQEGFSREIPAR